MGKQGVRAALTYGESGFETLEDFPASKKQMNQGRVTNVRRRVCVCACVCDKWRSERSGCDRKSGKSHQGVTKKRQARSGCYKKAARAIGV